MARVSIRKVAPGMRLRRPVVNRNGLVMVAEDTELTEPLIKKMQKIGIDSVHVHGMQAALPSMREALTLLDQRFSNVEDAPHMDVLKRLLREHIESLYECHGPSDPEG